MSLVEFVHVTKKFKKFTAVSDLSFQIDEKESIGLVGESGCGKSTTANLMLGLLSPTTGEVIRNGEKARRAGRDIQMVFQDTAASLNPRIKVFDSVAEPLQNYERMSKEQLRERVAELLQKTGLSAESMDKYPKSFSGGQRQRIAIARALALKPKLLILDEATSNLDVSVQAQILNLLRELKEQYSLSYLVISHDLGVIRYLCDRILVMKDGKIVEELTGDSILKATHPYTQLLLNSVPRIQK